MNRHHHTTANASTPTLTQPTTQRRQRILTLPNITKHKHITHFQHRYRPTSFQVARGLHKMTCSPNKAALALWHSGKVRAMCTERANWTSDHCHCHWEQKHRELTGDRKNIKRETSRERKSDEQREREKRKRTRREKRRTRKRTKEENQGREEEAREKER